MPKYATATKWIMGKQLQNPSSSSFNAIFYFLFRCSFGSRLVILRKFNLTMSNMAIYHNRIFVSFFLSTFAPMHKKCYVSVAAAAAAVRNSANVKDLCESTRPGVHFLCWISLAEKKLLLAINYSSRSTVLFCTKNGIEKIDFASFRCMRATSQFLLIFKTTKEPIQMYFNGFVAIMLALAFDAFLRPMFIVRVTNPLRNINWMSSSIVQRICDRVRRINHSQYCHLTRFIILSFYHLTR